MKERNPHKAAFIAALFFLSALSTGGALASMSVSPIRIYLDNEHDKDVVRVSNVETTPKSYQVEIVSWSQTEERREVYSPTEDLIVVPPLFTLEPGEEQLVRVGMLEKADPAVERSYRMFITELAPPQEAKEQTVGLSMRLQIGVPVFVAPSQSMPTSTFDFVDSKQIGDQLFMRFKNNGNRHVKVTEVQFSAAGSGETTVEATVLYLLAGQSGYLPVTLPEGASTGTVTVVTEGLGSLEYALPVAP